MAYELSYRQQPTYLHVVVTGENRREDVAAYMQEVIHECTLRQCLRVLIEERLVGPRLGTLEVFELVAAGAARHLRVVQAMAYVDVNAHGDTMQFAETVAVNRAFPVKVFATVAAAENWLLEESQPAAGAGPQTTRPQP